MAKSFFSQRGVEYTERGVTVDPKAMDDLKRLVGRFVAPTIVIGKEVLLGFAANRTRIEELLA